MGLRLLLSYTLLSIYVLLGTVVDAQRSFIIRSINLSMEPSTDVTRGTSVTVRCKAIISRSGSEPLSREYTMYKDNEKVYTKTSSTSEDFLYSLSDARVSNIGKYMCMIKIEDKEIKSDIQKLTVTGLSKPMLHLNKGEVTEGEEITATCSAPNETGSFFFYFYDGSKLIAETKGSFNKSEAKLPFSSAGIHKIHCSYTVSIMPDSFRSGESNTVNVSVKELPITLVMEIYPLSNIYEGDRLNILCTIMNILPGSENINLYLSQGTHLLSSGDVRVNHSMIAQANNPGEFECRLETGRVEKVVNKTVSVTELFSTPILTMSPAEVFQKDLMTLTCKSEIYTTGRLNHTKLIYSLEPSESHLAQTGPHTGVFSGKAPQYEVNYTCAARARGIMKRSETLTVHPKVSVSTPKISLIGRAVIGKTITILCESDTGSLPINYTLLKYGEQKDTKTVSEPSQQATFTDTITSPDEIRNYMCHAMNNHRDKQYSARLNATAIEPLEKPNLIVLLNSSRVHEGQELLLICDVRGTRPVTYKFYRNNNNLETKTSNETSVGYHIESLNKDDSGNYYCEAVNQANTVHSQTITIDVYMAIWKQALIGGIVLLVVIVLVVMCKLYFKSKRGRREAAAELSVKPSSPKSDDSLTVNLTHNTEVCNTATVRVDKAEVSVWSERPPDTADDEVSSVVSSEADVEYTEVVHPQPLDPAKVPLRKGTDTVYSELKNSLHGAADHHDYGSVEYAELSGKQPEISHYSPEVNNYQDLPVPVD